MLVEVCVQNLEDALLAQSEGADRIELCTSLETGGITPSAGLTAKVLQHLQIPVTMPFTPNSCAMRMSSNRTSISEAV